MRIAIDGPVGAGKSTVARGAAERLGFLYIDTGAMYRAIGVYAMQNGVSPKDAVAVEALLPSITLTFGHLNGEQHVYINGADMFPYIRTPEASMAASDVSAQPPVRAFLLEQQRAIARERSVVMDGRDIGTVVLPDAECKIFLTADPKVRAMRRWKELQAKGSDVPFEEVLADLEKRDHQDSTRAIAPLRPADDAVILDCTELDLEGSILEVLSIVRKKIQ